MALFYGYSSDPEQRAGLVLNIWVLEEDAAGNRSKVAWVLDYFDNSAVYGGTGTSAWSATAAGNTYSGSVTYNFTGQSYSQIRLLDNSAGMWLAHNTNGTQSVAVTGSVAANSPVGATSVGGTLTLTDYARPPAAPTAPTVTRSGDGTTIGITSGVPTSPLSITAYQYVYSADGSNWAGPVDMGNSTTATLAAPSASTGYTVLTRAYSSEGWGAWSPGTFIAGIPTAPASITTSRNARNVTVQISPSVSNGGAAITAYRVQYSSNNGSSWSSAVDMTANSYTYSSLIAGTTYVFRAYAVNSLGQSAYSVSAPVFVSGGGRRYDGTSQVATTIAKRYDGTSFVDLTTAKRYTGTAWVDLS